MKITLAIAGTVKGVSKTMTTFLLLATISLVVGGLVIANIMLISVNERKKEIGIVAGLQPAKKAASMDPVNAIKG